MCAYLLATVLLAAGPEFEARMLDGSTLTGQLAEIGPGKKGTGPICRNGPEGASHKLDLSPFSFTIETAGGPIVLEADKLIGLSAKEQPQPSAERAAVQVELIDGSSVAAEGYAVRDDGATLALSGDRKAELPVASVAAVRLHLTPGDSPGAKEVAGEWQRILGMEFDADVLVVRKGDALDYHHGVLHDVTDSVVHFELDGDTLPVKRSKVYGLIYYRTGDGAQDEAVCRLIDADGSGWSVRSLAMPAEGELRWTTPAEATVTGPLAQVVEIDFSRDKLIYLSDLKPESVVFTPYFGKDEDLPLLGRFFAPRNDTNLQSGPLRLADEEYAKGVALHSRTQIVYRLPGRFSRFEAIAGIDDGVRPLGNVRLVIRGDDKVLLEATLTGDDPPKPIDADITGVRRITVLVDFADESDVADHLDLCNARVIK